MKRNIVVIAVLVLGICCFSGMTVGAAQNETQEGSQGENIESQASEDAGREESGESQAESEEGPTEAEDGRESEESQTADEKPEETELCSLEIPQKLGVVIDPWEMDGRGQIYSEPYTIRNTGEEDGILTLSFLCRAPEGSNAEIRTDCQGLHDGEDKSIYLEMIFGDGTRVVLCQEGAEYEKVLEAGEELTVSISGEVNENAFETWRDGDVEVEGIYSWKVLGSTYSAEEESIPALSSEENKEQEAASEESGSEEEPSEAGEGQEASSEESSGEAEAFEESKDSEDPSKESGNQGVSSEESGAQDASAEGNSSQDTEESGAEEKTSQEASGEETSGTVQDGDTE